MNDHLVSVITPAYKAEKTIAETIRSVQAQTYPDWEMLVVDDGSPDGTAGVVAQFALEDPRVRLIRQANAGPAMARQAALEQARGRYVAFLDSDDLWLPEKLARQLEFMSQYQAAISYTSFRRIRADGSGAGHRIRIPARLTYRQLLGNTALATSTVLIDRALTGDFQMTKTYYDDFVLWLEILKRGHVALGLNEDLMRYRVMGLSVSRNKGRSARMVWGTYREIERLSLPVSAFHFVRYAVNAWRKYRTF
ncbi:glycosyltransferase family 2 protein [Azospira restricta]|nr:glycosyltransferase family 2 protein [Azospira restricta]